MKLKQIGRLASFLIATLLFALPTITAKAQGNTLSICGKALNSSDNYSDIKRDGLTAGTISYDEASKTLTLDNVVLEYSPGGYIPLAAINSGIKDLTIKVVGTNKVFGSKSALILSQADVTITGEGSLELTSSNGMGIYAFGSVATIKDCNVKLEGRIGFMGEDPLAKTGLIVKNSNVLLKGSQNAASYFFKFETEGCSIVRPEGAQFVKAGRGIMLNGEFVTECEIRTADKKAPTIADQTITVGEVKESSIALSWNKATDETTAQSDLEYTVYYRKNSVASYASSEKMKDVDTYTLTDLDPETTYSFYVEVSDAAGNTSDYTEGEATTSSGLLAYNITINGTAITNKNADNVTGEWLKEGKISYDSQSKTLKLQDVKLDSANEGIVSSEPGLAIELTGKNFVHATDVAMKLQQADVTIKGLGEIEVTADNAAAILLNNAALTIDRCALKAKGKYGIQGSDADKDSIIIKETIISAEGAEGSICQISNISSKGCKITQPRKAIFDPAKRCVTLNGELVKTEVIIQPADVNPPTLKDPVVKVGQIMGKTIMIYWELASDDVSKQKDLRYIVFYKKDGATEYMQSDTLLNKDGYVMQDLEMSTKYSFYVKVMDEADNETDYFPNYATTNTTIPYDITIGGDQVTSENASNIRGTWLKAGKLYYDAPTNTLTLENAEIKTQAYAILSYTEGLRIELIGENKIFSGRASSLYLSKKTTITGEGSLNVETTDNCGIFLPGSSLTIEDCTVTTKGKWGVAGNNSTEAGKLLIKNAKLTAEGSNGSICDMAELTLEGSYIKDPEGAAFDADLFAVALGGQIVTEAINIVPIHDGITSAEMDTTNAQSAVYTLSGTKVNTPINKLNKGIYIVNGKKLIVK